MVFLDQILSLGIIIAVMAFLTRNTNKRIDDINKRMDDTNKRMDDTNRRIEDVQKTINQRFNDFKESMMVVLEAKITPLQNQVENHIPSAIREIKKDQDKLKENQEKMQKTQEQILALLERQSKTS